MHHCDVICMMDDKGTVTPLRVRVDLGRSIRIVRIDRVINSEVRDIKLKKFIEYRCVGEGEEFQLLYDVHVCKWYVGK